MAGFVNLKWKNMFFDSALVKNTLDEETRRALSKFGAFTRATAKESIKTRLGPSKPGMPPHSHIGHLKRGIMFGYDSIQKSVVIGPVKLPKPHDVPHTLEYGGIQTPHKNPKRRDLKVGGFGIIKLGLTGRTSVQTYDKRGKRIWVTRARLRSERMVARAQKLEEQIYGPLVYGGKGVAARPYMGPAFAKELATNPPQMMWRLK